MLEHLNDKITALKHIGLPIRSFNKWCLQVAGLLRELVVQQHRTMFYTGHLAFWCFGVLLMMLDLSTITRLEFNWPCNKFFAATKAELTFTTLLFFSAATVAGCSTSTPDDQSPHTPALQVTKAHLWTGLDVMMCLMIIFWTWSCGCPWSPCLPDVFGAIQTMAAIFVWTNMIHSIVSIMFTNDPHNLYVRMGKIPAKYATIGKMTPTLLMWQLASSMIMFDGDGDALNVWQISQTIPTIYATIGKMTPILPRSGSWHLPWFTHEAWPRGRRGRRPPTTVSPSWILIEILDSGSWILDPGYWVEIFNPGFEEVRRWSCCLAFLIKCKTATFVN